MVVAGILILIVYVGHTCLISDEGSTEDTHLPTSPPRRDDVISRCQGYAFPSCGLGVTGLHVAAQHRAGGCEMSRMCLAAITAGKFQPVCIKLKKKILYPR